MREARARHAKSLHREYIINHELRPGTTVFIHHNFHGNIIPGKIVRVEYMPYHYKDGGYFNCSILVTKGQHAGAKPIVITFPNQTFRLELAQGTLLPHLINRPMEYW